MGDRAGGPFHFVIKGQVCRLARRAESRFELIYQVVLHRDGMPNDASGEDLDSTIRSETPVGRTRKARSGHQRADCSHETRRDG